MSTRQFALAVALVPAAADAQSLARHVADVRDGTLAFSYAARAGVCGDGRDMVRDGDSFLVFPSTRGFGRNGSDYCTAGPVRVVIGRRDGATVSYRVHVGARWSSAEDATDLGVVSAPDAARYLLDAATRAHGNNAQQALAAAVFADSTELSGALAALARDKSQDRELRQNAVFWIGSYNDDAASKAIRALAGEESLEDQLRGAAIIALGRDDPSDDDIAWLRRLYPSLSEKLRSDVFLAVSRSDSPRASGWLSDIVTNDAETEHTREQALFWLGQGRGETSYLVRLYDRLDRPELRRHFTFVLSQRHDDAALNELIAIAEHDPDRDVRRQALFWIGQSKDPRALSYLRDLVTR
jgi:HEAT repeat protein